MRIYNKQLKQEAFKYKFKNGLTAYILPTKNTKTFLVTIKIKFGGLFLNYKNYQLKPGSAHFYEHVAFNSETTNYLDEISKHTINVNASTSVNGTTYYFTSHVEPLEPLLLYLEMFRNTYLSEEVLKKEQQIISEEIKMKDDNPIAYIAGKSNEMFFINSNRKHTVLGKIDDIMNITLEDLNFIKDYVYVTKNMTIDIVGNVDEQKYYEVLKKFDATFNNNKPAKLAKIKEPKTVKSNYYEETKAVDNNFSFIKYKIPRPKYKKGVITFVRDIIEEIALGSESLMGEKFKELKLYNTFFVSSIKNEGKYDSLTFLSDTNDVNKLAEAIDNYLLEELEKEFSERAIEIQKRKILGTQIMEGDSEMAKAVLSIQLHNSKTSYQKYLKRIENIDQKTILKYLKSINVNNKVILYLKQQNNGEIDM